MNPKPGPEQPRELDAPLPAAIDDEANPRKVLLFLAQGFEDLEALSVIDVCGWTQYREHLPAVTVTTTGFHPEVRGRFGTALQPQLSLDEVDPADYVALALPGGFHSHGYDEAYDPRLHEIARAIHGNGGAIATMCVGVLPIAQAGLLRHRRATTYPHSRNHDNLGKLREYGCLPTAGPLEVSDRIISCAGPAQSVEVVLLLLEQIVGVNAAEELVR